MTMERSRPWPLGRAVILCGLVAMSFIFFSVPCSYAIITTCACTQTCTTSLNFGPLKVGGPGLGSTANLHPACGDVGVMSIMSNDPSFTISYSNLPGPSCNGFSWNSGNQGALCYFGVNFAPVPNGSQPATGQHSTTITVTYTNNNIATGVFLDYGAGFTLSPEVHDNGGTDAFRLMYESQSSPGFGSITFDPGNATINSRPKLSYHTSQGVDVPKPNATASIAAFEATATPYVIGFGTLPSGVATPDALYPIAGGQLKLNSVYSAPSSAPTPIGNNPSNPNLTTGYVTGIPSSQSSPGIPYQSITTQLTTIYQNLIIPATDPNFVISGATTPALLTQIATQESGYQQFLNPPIVVKNQAYYPYEIMDSWPLESLPTKASPDRGSHLGLMQLPVIGTNGEADAWSWVQNTTDGLGVFQTKVNTAYRLADLDYTLFNAVGPPTTLPALTACQLEEMALALYGPYGGAKASNQYLVPKCVGGKVTNTYSCSGTWQWMINNPKGSTEVQKKERNAVCYVVCVRKKIHPSPPAGSVSMCAGTSPLPDPPTGLKCGC